MLTCPIIPTLSFDYLHTDFVERHPGGPLFLCLINLSFIKIVRWLKSFRNMKNNIRIN